MLVFGPIGLFVYTIGVIVATYVYEHRERYFDDYEKGVVRRAFKKFKAFFKDDFFGIRTK